MRSNKLVPALAAAAMLLALAPAGAAAKRAAIGATCRLNLEAPSAITAGESAKLQGNLTGCAPAAAAAQTAVSIRARPARTHGAVAVATVNTQNGTFELTVTPGVNTTYFATAPGARGSHKTVLVSPTVSFGSGTPADGAQLLTGAGAVVGVKHANSPASHAVTFTGTVTPSHTGQLVVLQREAAATNEEWVRIDAARINGNHEFTIKHVFKAPGDANVRVVAEGTRTNAAGATETRSYVISQPQNPNLTITVSKDPIAAGEKVEITGKGAPNSTVTLLARNKVPGAKYVPVTTTKTDPSGNYTFSQTPEKNTFYRTSDGTALSAIVFEGVKYALKPGAPPSTTVQAGTPLTFTGKVAPTRAGLAGHPVYLERQGAARIGYLVSEVGQVNATGEYTVSRAFFIPGTYTLRVKVPGDPENEGASTSLVTVTVTPAPPGTLRPEPPTKEPGQGQL